MKNQVKVFEFKPDPHKGLDLKPDSFWFHYEPCDLDELKAAIDEIVPHTGKLLAASLARIAYVFG